MCMRLSWCQHLSSMEHAPSALGMSMSFVPLDTVTSRLAEKWMIPPPSRSSLVFCWVFLPIIRTTILPIFKYFFSNVGWLCKYLNSEEKTLLTHAHTTLWLPCTTVHWQGLRKLHTSQRRLLVHVATLTEFVCQSVSRSPLLRHFVNVRTTVGTGILRDRRPVSVTLQPTHPLSPLPARWRLPQKLDCTQTLCITPLRAWKQPVDGSSNSPMRQLLDRRV